MAVIVENHTLRLYGSVLLNYGNDEFFTASEVARALSKIGEEPEIRVHINSGGGDAMEGSAIHSLLTARRGRVNVVVEGLAASAASLIAMAGKTITMMPGALMMIHDCWGGLAGNAGALRHKADSLDLMSNTYAKVYAERTGKPAKVCRDLMKAETWFSPETAVAEGFANRVGAGPTMKAMAFNYATYAHAPPQLIELAKARDWNTTPISQVKEIDMTEDMQGARVRMKAILQSKEAEGRKDLAEHLAFETDMTAEAVIALLAKAPAAPAPGPFAGMSYDDRRVAAARLAMPAAYRGELAEKQSPVDLIAGMKRRHGVE